MFDLKLRQQFTGLGASGTAVELSSDSTDRATLKSAKDFLHITYPTRDILKAMRAMGEAQGEGEGRPIVVVGERGSGKSHLMAALYFAYKDAGATSDWLERWASRGVSACLGVKLPDSRMKVICESMHSHKFKTIWDVIFSHSGDQGLIAKAFWEKYGDSRTDCPSSEIIRDLFEKRSTVLALDEFQSWYESLSETPAKPQRQQAYNFLQQLQDIAVDHPDRLKLVISVRSGQTDAVSQIRRKSHEVIDFKAAGTPGAIKSDRRQMLLHRLFENRPNISPGQIESAIDVHVKEFLRLKNVLPAMHQAIRQDYIESWPFSPDLLNILEDEVLIATTAQGTRDLIRILAGLYRARGKNTCILTAADVRVDDSEDGSSVASLLGMLSGRKSLHDKALHNIRTIQAAQRDWADAAPHQPARCRTKNAAN